MLFAAEQGDPLGSLYCGIVLIYVVGRTREHMRATLDIDSDIFFDVWYMDDGQVVLDPMHVHIFLQLFDEELQKVGATRGYIEHGGDASELKSVAKFVGSPDSIREVDGSWATAYVRSSCQIAESNRNGHVLGIDFGGLGVVTNQFDESVEHVGSLHKAIGNIGNAGSELVLLRRCANVCKLTHLLRSAGHFIAHVSLQNFDKLLDRSPSLILGDTLHDEAILQA